MKKKITIVSLSFIGAAILWFICLIASQLFFDGNVFDKGISAFIWRFLIILLIVGFSGILLLTSVSIYEDNKTLAYVSGAMILLTALFALLFFIIGKYEKGFLSYCTLDLVIVSLLVNQITDMQYRAKKSLSALKIAAGVTGGAIALILLLSVHSLAGALWSSTAFVFFLRSVVPCVYRLENRRRRNLKIIERKSKEISRRHGFPPRRGSEGKQNGRNRNDFPRGIRGTSAYQRRIRTHE